MTREIGDVYYEKHTVTGISKRTGSVSETKVEIVEVMPIEKIRSDIQKLRGCSCSCSDGIIDDIEDILDKYEKKSKEAL